VGQELADSHATPPGRDVRQVARDRIVEPEPAVLLESEHRGGVNVLATEPMSKSAPAGVSP
jgi:hypothetical protein